MIINSKPVVPAGVILLKQKKTSVLFKFLAFLAKPRIVLLFSGYLKKPVCTCVKFFNCCITASSLLDDVKTGSKM